MRENLKLERTPTASKGIALLVALATMIVVLIAGSLVIYLVTRGLNVTSGQARYETVYEAAVAGLEIGKAKAESLNTYLDAPPRDSSVIRIGPYNVVITAERTASAVITMSGTAIKFARAIAGPGATPASGSYRTYYVTATAIARSGERVGLEILERFTVQQ
ncbi:MAG: hypothetical protein N3A65_03825 [candidate division WOR-3 bacterium]|nr:hypothetical protein [candidate division WOR-3 bacterium]